MKKVSRRTKVLGILMLVCTVLLAFAIYWLFSSNEGEIKQPNKQSEQSAITGFKNLDGQYVSLEYPAAYHMRTLDANGGDLEIYDLDASTTYTKKVAVSVSDLPDGTLNTNSAYLLRKSHTDKYRQRIIEPKQSNIQVWVSNDNREQTVFITQNGRVSVLAFTQLGGDTDDLAAEVDAVIKSFRWK